jgi:hypothetical protein
MEACTYSPSYQETKVEEPLEPGVQSLPGQHRETLKKKKKSDYNGTEKFMLPSDVAAIIMQQHNVMCCVW